MPSPAFPPNPGRGSPSTNFTCRHVECPTEPVLSYEKPDQSNPSSLIWFHSLHATSHALQPIHNVESVRNAVVRPELFISKLAEVLMPPPSSEQETPGPLFLEDAGQE